MKETFEPKAFRPAKLAIIAQAEKLLREYERKGYDVTVRQLYYRFIADDLFPEDWIDPVYNAKNGLAPDTKNTQKNYQRMVNTIGEARLAGLLDWGMIKDRARATFIQDTYPNAAEFLKRYVDHFQVDRWEGQPYHVEVMVEKQALEGILIPICEEYFVPFSANKGYSSLSMFYRTGKRLQERTHIGKKKCVILYLGDHDPSGLGMSEDVHQRLSMFAQTDIEVRRLALNIDQVEALDIPDNPTKDSDSRTPAYVERFGDKCWELDAFPVDDMVELVTHEIQQFIKPVPWDRAYQRGEEQREKLADVINTMEGMI